MITVKNNDRTHKKRIIKTYDYFHRNTFLIIHSNKQNVKNEMQILPFIRYRERFTPMLVDIRYNTSTIL